MSDASGKPTHGFHFLGVAELLFQSPVFCYVLGKQLEEDGVAFVAKGTSGEAHVDGSVILVHPVSGQSVEFFERAEKVRQAEPLLRAALPIFQKAYNNDGHTDLSKLSNQELQQLKRALQAIS